MEQWNVWMDGPDPSVWEPLLRAACCAGRVDEARALVAEHGVRTDQNCFVAAVMDATGRHGHVPIGQWAVAEHGLDVQHFAGIRMFTYACEAGHVHVCQWLTDRGFDPHRCQWADEYDWQQVGSCSHVVDSDFETAVASHHWAVARWLVQRRPEHPWPAKALTELIARTWSPARDSWMRSVTAMSVPAHGCHK